MVQRINNAFRRADEIAWAAGGDVDDSFDFFAPIVADAEAGFGGVLNTFELMKAMIQAGAAGVHFEDQLASVKKCGHMGGKVLVPTKEAVQKLIAARLAADLSRLAAGAAACRAAGADVPPDADLVVNATSVGMDGRSDPAPWLRFSGREIVSDVVYTPPLTPFIRRAAAAGCRTVTGDLMFEAQAAAQYRLFRTLAATGSADA